MTLLPSALLPSHLAGDGPTGLNQNRSAYNQQRPYALGDPGVPARTPTLVIAVFDDSGSVTGRGGNDPLDNRYGEARHAFEVVAQRGSRHELGAVLHFDTPSPADVRPVALGRWGLRELRRGLRSPAQAFGSSELGPALSRACDLALAHHQHQTVLVVLSDFLLMDAEPGPVLDELTAFPGPVHAVVLGSELPAGLLDERVVVTAIGREDPPGAVAQAVFTSLMTYRQPLRVQPGGDSSRIPQRAVRRGKHRRPAGT